MFSQRQLGITGNVKAKSSEKLSTGYRINRAADDAAGLSISEKMRRQIRGLHQGSKNVQDGISLLQVADGALAEVTDMLHRMNELSVKASNDTLQDDDRRYIQDEVDELIEEIDRVGVSTTFNERRIFHDLHPDTGMVTNITELVTSSAAESGRLNDAYQVGTKYYPSATLDFSGVDASNIGLLNGKGFTFTCAQNCSEKFEFRLDTTTNTSHMEGLTTAGRNGTHIYVIGVQDCANGSDILDAMFNFAMQHPMSGDPTSATSVPVSHSNTIVRKSPTELVLWGKTSNGGYNTPEQAKNHTFSPGMGKIDCSSITSIISNMEDRTLWIHSGTEEDHGMYITINRMNGDVIGVRNLDVTTAGDARSSIDRVKNAIHVISRERALLGAQQNRLEHTLRNNQNVEENTTASESLIRDTNMSDEMVRFSNAKILEEAGISMLTQANQSTQGILTLLS